MIYVLLLQQMSSKKTKKGTTKWCSVASSTHDGTEKHLPVNGNTKRMAKQAMASTVIDLN